MKLKHDVFSTYRPACKYANAGEDVKMISDCGNVVIVQASNANRFSVPKEYLTEEEVEIKVEEINIRALPDTEATNPIIKQVQVSKKRAAPINQQSLF